MWGVGVGEPLVRRLGDSDGAVVGACDGGTDGGIGDGVGPAVACCSEGVGVVGLSDGAADGDADGSAVDGAADVGAAEHTGEAVGVGVGAEVPVTTSPSTRSRATMSPHVGKSGEFMYATTRYVADWNPKDNV